MEAACRSPTRSGVALQLTNILRDIREDYRNGRVYLPAEDLERFGCTLDSAGAGVPPASRGDAAARPGWSSSSSSRRTGRATGTRSGMRLMPMLDGRSAACTGAMAGIYRKLLERIAAEPAGVLHGRLSLSRREKAMVAVRSLARPLLAARTPRRREGVRS